MEIPTHAELVAQIDSFLTRHDMAPSRFGRDALKEPQFVLQLREGRLPNLRTLLKIKVFMAERDRRLIEAAESIGFIAGGDTPGRKRPHRLNAEAR